MDIMIAAKDLDIKILIGVSHRDQLDLIKILHKNKLLNFIRNSVFFDTNESCAPKSFIEWIEIHTLLLHG